MASSSYLLAIDQGTTSSRAIVFDGTGGVRGQAQQEFRQIFPADGWVEHDPEDIWNSVLAVCRGALADAKVDAAEIAATGITNQRETTVVWNRADGNALTNAIVWQDRRTADLCADLVAKGAAETVRRKTGLVVDAYFSGSKIRWILDNVPGARTAAARGELAFGTVDSFLLWRLTGGKVHATDATNASRTMLFNIHTQEWDPELLDLLQVPVDMLPEVLDSSAEFGAIDAAHFGTSRPVCGIAGDQQAAAVGQACFEPGMVKSTYGTGCFVLLNTGETAVESHNRLLTTIAYRLDGTATYAIEGSIFNAGTAVQWLRDGLSVIDDAAATEAIAEALRDTGGAYLVPAFTGLGAPYWDAHARGAVIGITRDTTAHQLVRAALESVCYQTRDLTGAMRDDGAELSSIRVDGGMVANNWVLQFLADVLDLPVERPEVIETTALGAAYLAGLKTGIYGSLDDIATQWRLDRAFKPAMSADRRQALYDGWRAAVGRVLTAD